MMSNRLLAAIRAAVSGRADDLSAEDEPTSPPENPENTEVQTQLEENAMADATAITEAEKRGAKAANDRLATVLTSSGINGDGKRMSAALDLATGSPAMSADAVVSFVTANIPVSGASAPTGQQAHDRRRLSAMPHALPEKTESSENNLTTIMKRRHGIE